MHIKQPSFDSVNAALSVANGFVELLRTKNVHEASILHFGSASAFKNMLEPSILRRSGETAFAISPDNADQGLRFGMPVVHRRTATGWSRVPDAVQRVSDAPQSRTASRDGAWTSSASLACCAASGE
jgi:hypothetical protein